MKDQLKTHVRHSPVLQLLEAFDNAIQNNVNNTCMTEQIILLQAEYKITSNMKRKNPQLQHLHYKNRKETILMKQKYILQWTIKMKQLITFLSPMIVCHLTVPLTLYNTKANQKLIIPRHPK